MPHNTTFTPATVITNRNRLWRVDGLEGDVLSATSIDGGEAEQIKFCIPFEDIRPGRLDPPSPDIVGHPSAQDLLLRAYRLSLLHGTAPLISLQRSRVIPKDYQLVPVVMALETPRVRMLIGSPLDGEATHRLLRVSPSSGTRTEAEVQEALANALVIEELETMLHGAVEARRQHLATDRRTMREQMEQRGGAQTAEWLRGIADLSPGSFDLLAVTVLFPG